MTIKHKKKLFAVSLAAAVPLLLLGGMYMSAARAEQTARIAVSKMIAAKEKGCTDALKLIPSIADVCLFIKSEDIGKDIQFTSITAYTKSAENKPLSAETIGLIGRFVAAVFGFTDLKDVRIIDTKVSRTYDGYGDEIQVGNRPPGDCVGDSRPE